MYLGLRNDPHNVFFKIGQEVDSLEIYNNHMKEAYSRRSAVDFRSGIVEEEERTIVTKISTIRINHVYIGKL
jgi:hypothetical protein